MLVRDFDFDLPPELIAQTPISPRDAARLLHLQRENGAVSHHVFRDLTQLLRPDDLLVFNDTRVLRARLRGHKIVGNSQAETSSSQNAISREVQLETELRGARVEALLLRERERNVWETLLKPSARLRVGTRLRFVSPDENTTVEAVPLQRLEESWIVRFSPPQNRDVRELLAQLGEVPLPPYIQSRASSEDDYQTVYARPSHSQSSTRCDENDAILNDTNRNATTPNATTPNAAAPNAAAPNAAAPNATLESSAAPTAGLHFTPQLMENLREHGVESCFVTLGIGIGTFRPMQSERVEEHKMHREEYEISGATARKINAQKARGKRVVAVGTTSVRVLESAVDANGNLREGDGETAIFIRPGHKFQIVDALITNFHLPKSTLLVMISAFAQNNSGDDGLAKARAAYDEAINEKYRFFSFGDAMLID